MELWGEQYGRDLERVVDWEDPELESNMCERRWCSLCFELCEHTPVTTAGGIFDSLEYACSSCSGCTQPCSAKLKKNRCSVGMAAVGSASNCAACTQFGHKQAPESLQYWLRERARARWGAAVGEADASAAAVQAALFNDQAAFRARDGLDEALAAADAEYEAMALEYRGTEVAALLSDSESDDGEEAGGAGGEDGPLLGDKRGRKTKAEEEAEHGMEGHEGGAGAAAHDSDEEDGGLGGAAAAGKKKGGKGGAGEGADGEHPHDDHDDDEDDEDEEHDEAERPSWEGREGIRKQAVRNGMIRPLLALVAMTGRERIVVAAKLGICLSRGAAGGWGDAYYEARTLLWQKSVLGKRFSMQQRCAKANEKMSRAHPLPNWYEVLYRVYQHELGVVRDVPQEMGVGGRHRETTDLAKDTVFADTVHLALDPDAQIVTRLEAAFAARVHAKLAAGGEGKAVRLGPFGRIVRTVEGNQTNVHRDQMIFSLEHIKKVRAGIKDQANKHVEGEIDPSEDVREFYFKSLMANHSPTAEAESWGTVAGVTVDAASEKRWQAYKDSSAKKAKTQQRLNLGVKYGAKVWKFTKKWFPHLEAAEKGAAAAAGIAKALNAAKNAWLGASTAHAFGAAYEIAKKLQRCEAGAAAAAAAAGAYKADAFAELGGEAAADAADSAAASQYSASAARSAGGKPSPLELQLGPIGRYYCHLFLCCAECERRAAGVDEACCGSLATGAWPTNTPRPAEPDSGGDGGEGGAGSTWMLSQRKDWRGRFISGWRYAKVTLREGMLVEHASDVVRWVPSRAGSGPAVVPTTPAKRVAVVPSSEIESGLEYKDSLARKGGKGEEEEEHASGDEDEDEEAAMDRALEAEAEADADDAAETRAASASGGGGGSPTHARSRSASAVLGKGNDEPGMRDHRFVRKALAKAANVAESLDIVRKMQDYNDVRGSLLPTTH
jgi:hypothetical protein